MCIRDRPDGINLQSVIPEMVEVIITPDESIKTPASPAVPALSLIHISEPTRPY